MLREKRIKLKLVTKPMPAHNEIRVCVPPIAYDEVLDCFYVTSADIASFTRCDLPANLHTKELLSIDPSDLDALLSFQLQWGLITTPKRAPLRYDSVWTGDVIATPQKGKTPEECIQEAQEMLNALDSRHPGFQKVAYTLLAVSKPFRRGIYPFVPRGEAEAAVTYLQNVVNELVSAAYEGYDPWSGIDEFNLKGHIDAIDAAISPYFPRFKLASQEMMDGTIQKPLARTLPTTIAILVQLITYLSSEEGYRVCKNPECRCYFAYKRHSPGELVRNRLSDYCQDSCQRRACAIRQAERRKKKRHEQKAERLRKEGQ